MTFRTLAAAFMLAVVTATASTMAAARTDVDVNIGIGPPPALVETVPPSRAGYVWAPGYWAWNGHKHVWKKGYWMHERRGYAWAPVPLGAAWRSLASRRWTLGTPVLTTNDLRPDAGAPISRGPIENISVCPDMWRPTSVSIGSLRIAAREESSGQWRQP